MNLKKNLSFEDGLCTIAEQNESALVKQCFDNNNDAWEKKLENFPKYVKRQNLTRFHVLYELYKRILPIKGCIVECGVFRGFGVIGE